MYFGWGAEGPKLSSSRQSPSCCSTRKRGINTQISQPRAGRWSVDYRAVPQELWATEVRRNDWIIWVIGPHCYRKLALMVRGEEDGSVNKQQPSHQLSRGPIFTSLNSNLYCPCVLPPSLGSQFINSSEDYGGGRGGEGGQEFIIYNCISFV